MRRILTALAIITTLATGMTLLTATAASAGDTGSCAGNLVLHKVLNYNGNQIGELDIYYNSSTGVNCAKMNHGGPTWGVYRDTWVYIGKCQETSPTGTCHLVTDDHDQGNFGFYAGPSKVTAGSHCITANGWIYWDGARRKVATGNTVLC
jgi:hypothetical protein